MTIKSEMSATSFIVSPILLQKNQWDSDIRYGCLLAQWNFKSWNWKHNRRIPPAGALAEAEAKEEYYKKIDDIS